MANITELTPHLSVSELQEAYRIERDTIRRSHLQVIWLLLAGDDMTDVARVTGFTTRWIRKLIARWNLYGPDSLGDRRRHNEGAEPLLDDEGLGELAAVLEGPPADGGLWSGRKVAAWMSDYLGREVSPKRGFDYLHRLGYSRQTPRPSHAKSATPEGREAFKKNSMRQWRKRGRAIRTARSKSGRSTSTE